MCLRDSDGSILQHYGIGTTAQPQGVAIQPIGSHPIALGTKPNGKPSAVMRRLAKQYSRPQASFLSVAIARRTAGKDVIEIARSR